jgi:phosphoribosylformimino-5-aminoimidazole carboxamide ribotide isomerase
MKFNTHSFEIFPALHLVGGKPLDFTQDDSSLSTIVEEQNPVDTVKFWIEQGARWVHIINVDACFDRNADHNWELLKQICQLPVSVQYGGGIRNAEDIRWALDIGVKRLLLNTAAVENPQLISEAVFEYGTEQLGLAINTTPEGEVMTRRWQPVGGLEAVTFGVQMRHLGITTAVHTRINPDGTMSGADLEVSRQLAHFTGLNIIVGGEVYDMDDVLSCYNEPGISGILIGKALHSGKINLARAISETSQKIAFETGLPKWKQEQMSMKAQIRYNLSLRYLLEHIEPKADMRVLDAGGGNGKDSLELARLYAHVDLVDQSSAMLQDFHQIAEEAGPHTAVNTHNFDLLKISRHFEPNTFDLVLCHNVIQYSDKWEALLESVIYPLNTNGIFSLIVRNQYSEPYKVNLDDYDIENLPDILDKTAGMSGVFESDLLYFTAPFLVNWLSERHFKIEAVYGLICLNQHPAYFQQADDSINSMKLETLEYEMGKREPYRDTAHYIQIIARKQS